MTPSLAFNRVTGRKTMHIKHLVPEAGFVQRNYCDDCGTLLDLTFSRYDEEISGVHVQIDGLPILQCPACGKHHLPDRIPPCADRLP